MKKKKNKTRLGTKMLGKGKEWSLLFELTVLQGKMSRILSELTDIQANRCMTHSKNQRCQICLYGEKLDLMELELMGFHPRKSSTIRKQHKGRPRQVGGR